MKRLLFFCFFLMLVTHTQAQEEETEKGLVAWGLDAQRYPAGFIFQAKADWAVGKKGLLMAKGGYNLARRQDFGKKDKEEGGGFGFSGALREYFKPGRTGFYSELQISTWFLDIDWEDDIPVRRGSTDITVIQPTIGIGYDLLLPPNVKLSMIIAFGYELNVITSGEPVGEGGISLVGLSASFLLR